MQEQVPFAVALGIGALLAGTGLAVALLTRRAADGRLRRNALAGIRTRATLSSDEAWRTGHAAARGLSDAAGVVFVLSGLAVVAVRDAAGFAVVALVGAVLGTVLLLVAAWRAGRAVRSG